MNCHWCKGRLPDFPKARYCYGDLRFCRIVCYSDYCNARRRAESKIIDKYKAEVEAAIEYPAERVKG